MTNKKTKIVIDIVMIIILTLLVLISFTGNRLHEILGIFFILLFTLHKIVNIKSIVTLAKQLIKKALNGKSKILVVTDIILTVIMISSCITGIAISKHTFNFNLSSNLCLYIAHTITSYLSVLIVILHTFLHRKSIVSGINNIFNITTRKIQEYMFNLFLLVCITLLANVFVKNNTYEKMKTMYYLNKQKTTVKTDTITNKEEEKKPVVVAPEKAVPTAEEITKYLGGLRCNGCSRRCILTSPQCMIGEQRAEQETATYIENYTTEK